MDLEAFGSKGVEPPTLTELRELAMADSDMWSLITQGDPLVEKYIPLNCQNGGFVDGLGHHNTTQFNIKRSPHNPTTPQDPEHPVAGFRGGAGVRAHGAGGGALKYLFTLRARRE